MTRGRMRLLLVLALAGLVAVAVGVLALVPTRDTPAGLQLYTFGTLPAALAVWAHASLRAAAPSDPGVAARDGLARLLRASTLLLVAAGATSFVVGAVLLAGATIGLPVGLAYGALLALALLLAERLGARVAREVPVDRPRTGDDDLLAPAAVRAASRRWVGAGLVVGILSAAVAATLGTALSGTVGALSLAVPAGAIVASAVVTLGLQPTVSAGGRSMLAAVDGDRSHGQRLARAVRRHRAAELDEDDLRRARDYGTALVRVLPALNTSGMTTTAAGLLVLVHQLALGRTGLLLALAVTVTAVGTTLLALAPRLVRRWRELVPDPPGVV